jgi:hypothetical protein
LVLVAGIGAGDCGFGCGGWGSGFGSGIHHRFGIGDGVIVVVDEWKSVDHFQKFFGDPDLQAFIGSVGGAPAPPEIIVCEAVASPDQF